MRNMPVVIEFNSNDIVSLASEIEEVERETIREDKLHWIKNLSKGLICRLDASKFDEIRRAKHEVTLRDEYGNYWHTIDIFRTMYGSYQVCQGEKDIIMMKLDVDPECLHDEEGNFNERGNYFYNGMDEDELRINLIRGHG